MALASGKSARRSISVVGAVVGGILVQAGVDVAGAGGDTIRGLVVLLDPTLGSELTWDDGDRRTIRVEQGISTWKVNELGVLTKIVALMVPAARVKTGRDR